MERTISDEEKIRKAIEISQRRNRNYSQQRISNVNINTKKDYKLFKRMVLQIIICLLIYYIFYLIETTNYTFSEGVLNQTSKILNYDINFYELYEKGADNIKGLIGKFQNNNDKNGSKEENIQENIADQNLIENNVLEQSSVEQTSAEENEISSLSQMEQDAIFVKDKYELVYPLEIKGKVTSEFGERETTSPIISPNHKGIDIAANEGSNILSAISGQVEVADKNSQYGNYIKVKKDDVITVYAHCKKLKVSKGDNINKGDVIATVGSTGNSTGPHLHFEIRLSNRYINPRSVIQF